MLWQSALSATGCGCYAARAMAAECKSRATRTEVRGPTLPAHAGRGCAIPQFMGTPSAVTPNGSRPLIVDRRGLHGTSRSAAARSGGHSKCRVLSRCECTFVEPACAYRGYVPHGSSSVLHFRHSTTLPGLVVDGNIRTQHEPLRQGRRNLVVRGNTFPHPPSMAFADRWSGFLGSSWKGRRAIADRGARPMRFGFVSRCRAGRRSG
jgi:hypothetical protein